MNQDPVAQNRRLVRSLQLQIDQTLKPLIPEGAQVAHVGYPNHWNAGDPAIWLGTKASLDRLNIKIVYQCGWSDYNRDIMAESVGDGPILIAGGGNFGDVWLREQLLREQVLNDFPENPVLQLPQSLWFDHQENLVRFQGICNRHPHFHILLRDHQSLRKAAKHLSAPTSLCPDMAFGLGSFERPTQPWKSIVWLSRSDKESTGLQKPLEALEIELQDWASPGFHEQAFIANAAEYNNRIKNLLTKLTSTPPVSDSISIELAACYHKLAGLHLLHGLKMLSSGNVVITDRLHGHVLCLLMGIPHIVLDNNYKKVSSMFECWTSSSPMATWAQSPKQAIREAMLLVDSLNYEFMNRSGAP